MDKLTQATLDDMARPQAYQPETQVQVTRADIDAAFEQASKGYQSQYDFEMDLRQAFARHRLSSTPASPSVELDEATAAAIWHNAMNAYDHDGIGERDDDAAIADLMDSIKSLRGQPASGALLRESARIIRGYHVHKVFPPHDELSLLNGIDAALTTPQEAGE